MKLGEYSEVGNDMRYVLSTILLTLLSVCLLGDLLDFIPADYDFFLLFKDNGTYYSKISSVPFFNFLLSEQGLGLEYVTKSLLENIGYSARVSPQVIYDALSKSVLFASKGIVFEVQSLFSIDINYYIEALRNIGTASILVFESEEPEKLLKMIAGITNLKLTYSEKTWVLQDTDVAIFARYYRGYLVMSGSKNALERAIDVYDRPTDQFVTKYSVRELVNQSAWISGFFRGGSFGINIAGVGDNSFETDYFTVDGILTEESLRLEIKQHLKKGVDLNKYLSSSLTMRNMPFIGNFAFSSTVSGPSDIAQGISWWFQGAQEEIRKMYQIISSILDISKDRVYLTGDLTGEYVRFAAIFNLTADFDVNLIRSYGAREFGDELRLPIMNGFVSFFKQGKDLIVTNMTKDEYLKLSNKRRLRDDSAYQYVSKGFPEKDIMRIYIDLGNLVESMLGLKARGRLLFSQFVESGVIVYKVEVM